MAKLATPITMSMRKAERLEFNPLVCGRGLTADRKGNAIAATHSRTVAKLEDFLEPSSDPRAAPFAPLSSRKKC